MDLDAYIAEHDGEWRRLEQLSRSRKLRSAEVDEMMMLYQRASTHLSIVRSRMPDPMLVARLSRLVLQARGAITGTPNRGWRSIGVFFTRSFPAACYTAGRWWLATAAAFVLLNALLIGYIASTPAVQQELMSQEQIDQLVNEDFAAYYSEFQNQNFALRVWTNNAQLAGMALVGGALIVPTLYVFWQNALNTGITGGVMVGNGGADIFFGLIAPHGLLEIGAFLLSCAVGLRIGWSWIAPGPNRTRGQALAAAGRSGIVVAIGLVVVLAVAGILEGFVTPNVPAIIAVPLGAIALTGFIVYVALWGRRAVSEGFSGDFDPDPREATAPPVPSGAL